MSQKESTPRHGWTIRPVNGRKPKKVVDVLATGDDIRKNLPLEHIQINDSSTSNGKIDLDSIEINK